MSIRWSSTLLRRVLDEHVRMPGYPQLVVTRFYLYGFLTATCGFDRHDRGFVSADYLAFGRPAVTEPLSDLNAPWVIAALDTLAKDVS